LAVFQETAESVVLEPELFYKPNWPQKKSKLMQNMRPFFNALVGASLGVLIYSLIVFI